MVRVLNGEGQLQREVETTLDALGHDAFFLTEEPYLADSNGAVEVWADRPIIAVSLRTDDSLLAGVPVIGAQGNGLDPGSINTEHLADGAVTGEKIADGAVVRSLNGLTDDVALVGGDNVEIQVNGNELTVSAAAGGGGTITGVNAGEGLTGEGNSGSVALAVANGGITSTHLADDSVGLSELAPEVSFGRVQQGFEGPNIILGDPSNSVGSATLATIGGGLGNQATGSLSTVGGAPTTRPPGLFRLWGEASTTKPPGAVRLSLEGFSTGPLDWRVLLQVDAPRHSTMEPLCGLTETIPTSLPPP